MSEQQSISANQSEPAKFGDNKVVKPKVKADSLIDQLRNGKKLHDDFAKVFREKYTISGKHISEWKEYFKVTMPPDLNPQKCLVLDTQLIELYQEASFFKAEVESRLASYKSANQDRYRAKYAELVAEFSQVGKKLPAKDTLVALAEHATSDIINAQVHGEIELAFWKEILNHLTNCRKLLDNATINLGIEAKALSGANRIEKIQQGNGLPSFMDE
jgi:hypothetical protein